MSILSFEIQIFLLRRTEKAELLPGLAREVGTAWSGIEKTAGVSGGEACVVNTRIPMCTLENDLCWLLRSSVTEKRRNAKV